MRSGYYKHLEKSVTAKQLAKDVAKQVPYFIPLMATKNRIVKSKSKKNINENKHPYATMSQRSYKRGKDRNIQGYDIDQSLSRDDITVYKHKYSKDVVLAFRGTDITSKVEKKPIKSPRDLWKSRRFRDLGADASLATYTPEYNHRFYNYKKTTQDAIKKYGQQNVFVTGHSLGGSGGLWVSKELSVPAVVYNPFIHPNDTLLQTHYDNAVIRHNPGDPISVLSPFANASKVEIDKSHTWKHGIQNWVDREKYMLTPRQEIPFYVQGKPLHGGSISVQ